jgi:ribosomal protein S18 acetylase RimI-like enzyme
MHPDTAARTRSEHNLYYIHVPRRFQPVEHDVEFLPVAEFIEHEDLCKPMWEMISNNFKTRSKFLAIWPSVRFVAVHRRKGELAGFLLVSAPLNWQIDYVAVRHDFRHQGIASSLVNETVNQALIREVPYVMLTSREGLRPLYEGQCGFHVVGTSAELSAAREEVRAAG